MAITELPFSEQVKHGEPDMTKTEQTKFSLDSNELLMLAGALLMTASSLILLLVA